MNSIVTFLGDNELTLESQVLPVLWGILATLKNMFFGCGENNLDNPHIGLKWNQIYGILFEK